MAENIVKDMVSRREIIGDINKSKDPTECPLTALQAGTIIQTLDIICQEQTEIKASQAMIQATIAEMRLENARRAGYTQGANFWFKVGASTMVVLIFGGAFMILLALTGNLDVLTKLGGM